MHWRSMYTNCSSVLWGKNFLSWSLTHTDEGLFCPAAVSKIVCTLATLSDSLFSGKQRGDQEAFEGLLWGVGSLEGSLDLLSRDFCPWTIMNPSSLVEGATGGVVMEVDVVFHGGCEAISSQDCLWASAPLLPGLAPPRRPVDTQGGISTSLVHGSFSLTTHLHRDHFQSIWWGSLLPSYDVVILLLQPMDFESLKKGGPGFFIVLPSSTPFGGLIASPMGMEGSLAQPLHVIERGLCPLEVCAVIQLFLLENYFMAPPLRLDPFCIVIEVLEAIPMHLLIEIVQENGPPPLQNATGLYFAPYVWSWER